MPSIAVRISDSEKIELDRLARGDISKYIRSVAFGEAKCRAESIGWLENRVEDLRENQAVLLETVRALVAEVRAGDGLIEALLATVEALAADVRELKAAPLPQPQSIATPAQDNSRLEGMTLELLLLLRRNVLPVDRKAIQATVESEGLPVWESSSPPSSFTAPNTTERRPQAAVGRPEPSSREGQSQGGGFFKKWR